MARQARLGELEQAVMDHLWSAPEPQTVRQVHEALSARRDLAYTTVMTVLQRLAKKNLVVAAPRRPRAPLRPHARPRRTGRRPDGRCARPGRRHRQPARRAGALRRTRRCGRGRGAARWRWPNWKPNTAAAHPRGQYPGRLAACRSSEGHCERVRAGLRPPRTVPGRSRARSAGPRIVAAACAAGRGGAVAGHRHRRRAVGIQRRYRDRQQALRPRSRRAADHDVIGEIDRLGLAVVVGLRRRPRA